MTERIIHFPDRKVLEAEAGAWLIRLDGDTPLADAEKAALRDWLARSPAHADELRDLARLWGRMNILTELAVPLESQQPAQTASRPTVKPRKFLPFTLPAAGALAAMLLAVVAATFWFNDAAIDRDNGLHATVVGEQKSLTLPDGSVVLLNTNTQVRVDYSQQFRDIRLLQGEAHFTVAKDAEHPFRVYAGSGRIQAVGTAFAVYLRDKDVNVTVTEGKVSLAVHADSLEPGAGLIGNDFALLEAGQSTVISAQANDEAQLQSAAESIHTITPPEMERQLSWRQGLLTFNGEPLEQVVTEISRYTNLSIQIDDPAIKAIKIGGQFQVGETEALLNSLEANFALRVTRLDNDRVLLTSASLK